MSRCWAVCMLVDDAASIGRMRCRPEIEVCYQGNSIWLSGSGIDKDLSKILRSLPGRRFDVLPDRQTVAAGASVPKGYLPEGPWIALSEWLSPRLAPAGYAAKAIDKVGLHVVRGGPVEEAGALLTSLTAWADYAITAPQIRLDRLTFAVGDEQRALLRGTPLPPIIGTRFIEHAGVAVQAGWTWQPRVDVDIVRELLGLKSNDLALLHGDGSWDHVRADEFVRARRSAVRMSVGGATDE